MRCVYVGCFFGYRSLNYHYHALRCSTYLVTKSTEGLTIKRGATPVTSRQISTAFATKVAELLPGLSNDRYCSPRPFP